MFELDIATILKNTKKYCTAPFCEAVYGIQKGEYFHAVVIAPGWKPDKHIHDLDFAIKQITQRSYTSSYIIQKEGVKILWLQCASGESNLVDTLLLCGELKFDALFFVGSAGSLTKEIPVGELCTPSVSISSPDWTNFLNKKLSKIMTNPRIEQNRDRIEEIRHMAETLYSEYPLHAEKVFCTPSIVLEYSHIKEIVKTGEADADKKPISLIEMETYAFLMLSEMFNVKKYILLATSDNIETKQDIYAPQNERYLFCRGVVIPNLIVALTKNPVAEKNENAQ